MGYYMDNASDCSEFTFSPLAMASFRSFDVRYISEVVVLDYKSTIKIMQAADERAMMNLITGISSIH